ncbi:MAG TPA: hydroxymethylpyrimidine/phosphomethylpyrimidine kinase [Gammaproteobacteria bacterium]|nr:hydroxymethylpyrimidine/phosphomethylpyrimidine kinase [Gammaproteobacteria bacterium]
MEKDSTIPAVLAFAGLDPSGGAGLVADVEAIASMGCHLCPVVTALTVQDSHRVYRFECVDSLLLVEQARTILADMPIRAIKIGMIGDVATAEVLHSLLGDHLDLPVVYDPVLAGGGGGALSTPELLDAVRSLILPLTTILTPNSEEARALAPEADSLDACAEELQSLGCEYVLITGGHEATPEVHNTLYGNHRRLEEWTWQRLPDQFHGSGCTLAAAIAGLLAHGLEPFTALHEAQEYTWESLQHGYTAGAGQRLPNRLFWARGDD